MIVFLHYYILFIDSWVFFQLPFFFYHTLLTSPGLWLRPPTNTMIIIRPWISNRFKSHSKLWKHICLNLNVPCVVVVVVISDLVWVDMVELKKCSPSMVMLLTFCPMNMPALHLSVSLYVMHLRRIATSSLSFI